ncbi:MAG: MoxR family ATPase [Clostridia bacterium]
MNIQQAKEHISHAITAYRTTDAYGRPMIPQQRQRPIFLVGAPGLGKTAIMEQIAAEMGIPLVSYSMTHHTRQSALGLPYIMEETFDGKPFRVSEYTMSEIVATVYRTMRETGVNEGILFLDEINCVSETLAPAMLQFLQYKVFGQHKIPQGWIVVTAGNPPEYNDSVREFDMATMDRVKRIDVQPDYEVWRDYALNTDIHPAVISYLNIYKGDFVMVQKSVDGLRFVTPRSWVDLSDILRLYELHQLPVDVELTKQYLQDMKIARNFASYYDLFNKYRADYQVEKILAGKAPEEIIRRAQHAPFDERFSLVSLLMAAISGPIRQTTERHLMLEALQKALIAVRQQHAKQAEMTVCNLLDEAIQQEQATLQKALGGSMIGAMDERVKRALIEQLKAYAESEDVAIADFNAAFNTLRTRLSNSVKEQRAEVAQVQKLLENTFTFCEAAFDGGQEMLIFVTELTRSDVTAKFISTYGSEAYFRHNKELLFYERQVKLIDALDKLDDSLE